MSELECMVLSTTNIKTGLSKLSKAFVELFKYIVNKVYLLISYIFRTELA